MAPHVSMERLARHRYPRWTFRRSYGSAPGYELCQVGGIAPTIRPLWRVCPLPRLRVAWFLPPARSRTCRGNFRLARQRFRIVIQQPGLQPMHSCPWNHTTPASCKWYCHRVYRLSESCCAGRIHCWFNVHLCGFIRPWVDYFLPIALDNLWVHVWSCDPHCFVAS